uniref:Uncharacterized protein n=1 Tax=Ditylum brightwellii TaxID=49249 RepID=A0A6U3VH73_9STRA|mmetsp:Transcript_25696/g.37697  ORF Transcript_25696/g.37697 Transcript_25696/m.37697 type:complete len:712 (+) Transcript_25696:68-2203(+)
MAWISKRRRAAAAYANLQWRQSYSMDNVALSSSPSSSPPPSLSWGRHLISRKAERNATTLAFGIIVLTTLISTDIGAIYRNLCSVPRPYVTVNQALSLPQHPNVADVNGASHIELCREFVRRNALDAEAQKNEPMFYMQEDMNVCADWSNPHAVLMEVFASSLVGKVGSDLGLVYNHDCRRGLPDHTSGADDNTLPLVLDDWDSTSVQQLLASSLISTNDIETMEDGAVLNLCKGCIAEVDARSAFGQGGINPHSTHQCLLFPGSGSTENSRVVLSTVLPSIKKRLRAVAVDWIDKTDPLPHEDETGVIVFLDETSILMHYSIYDKNIPDSATHLQILATASCAHASVTTGNTCIEHGRRVKRFMKLNRPNVYVRYDVVASTAASFARMIMVKTLICPPGTHSCLLPALSKFPNTDAIIAEAASSYSTFSWFGHVTDANALQNDGEDSSLDVLTLEGNDLEMSLEEIGERTVGVVNPLDEDEEESGGGGVEIGDMPTEGAAATPMRAEGTDNDLMVDGGTEPEAKVTAAAAGGRTDTFEGEYPMQAFAGEFPMSGNALPADVFEGQGEYPIRDYSGLPTEGLLLPSGGEKERDQGTNQDGNLVISGGEMSSGQTFQQLKTEGNLRGIGMPTPSSSQVSFAPEDGGDANDNMEGEHSVDDTDYSYGLPQGRGKVVPLEESGGPLPSDMWGRNRRREQEVTHQKEEEGGPLRR